MTAETMKKAFIGRYAERSGFFVVKGATGPKIPSASLQHQIVGNDADNIISLADLFDKFTGKLLHSYHLIII